VHCYAGAHIGCRRRQIGYRSILAQIKAGDLEDTGDGLINSSVYESIVVIAGAFGRLFPGLCLVDVNLNGP
jgi:hypothetical protein